VNLDRWFDEAAFPGSYLLLLRLNQATELTVGRLGRFILTAGWYVYVGSALGGLGSRLRRHLRREKLRHWHVDALREMADLVRIAYRVGPERLECAVAATLAERSGASRPVPRFGASDCRCPGHLIRFGDEPDMHAGPDWRVKSIIDE
jgi:Uri superfamily endonuclease